MPVERLPDISRCAAAAISQPDPKDAGQAGWFDPAAFSQTGDL